jgi:predicted ribosome quality control (RQC) complex YloA/Tae2 family protein
LQRNFELREIELLKLGRHFRVAPDAKLIVGRNERENEAIRALAGDNDLILTAMSVPGPTALVLGRSLDQSLELAAAITVAYSDAEDHGSAEVMVMGKGENRILEARSKDKGDFRHYML